MTLRFEGEHTFLISLLYSLHELFKGKSKWDFHIILKKESLLPAWKDCGKKSTYKDQNLVATEAKKVMTNGKEIGS